MVGGHESNMGGGELLCEELIEEILSRLLPDTASLIKCKYVSKSWSRLVTNVCCRGGATVGLIGLYTNDYLHLHEYDDTRISSELCLLHPPLIKQANTPPAPKNDYIMETTKFLDLYRRLNHSLDSCNGLIFLGGMHNYYYVGNPILNQWTLLPPPTPKQDKYLATGFAFDGIQGHHYKILHLFYREAMPLTNTIHCHVFSSETGHWRQHHAPIFNSFTTLSHCIKLIRGPSIKQKQGVYRNGALHWTFTRDHKYMLVFYVEKEVFRFIQLPGGGGGHDHLKCLWESKGFLHYAVSGEHDHETLHVWKNTNIDGDIDDKQHRWVHIHTVKYKILPKNRKDPKVLICMYDGCSSSLNRKIGSLLCLPKDLCFDLKNLVTILTYLSTINDVLDGSSAERLTLSWWYMRKNGGGISLAGNLWGKLRSYVYNLVDLPMWDGCTLLKHPN